MKVRTDVEVVVGAVDQGLKQVLDRIDTQSKSVERSVSQIGSTIRRVAGGLITFEVVKKVSEYVVEVGKAAQAGTELAETWKDGEAAFADFRFAIDEAIGGLLEKFLPFAIHGFENLAIAIENAAHALGLIAESRTSRLAALLNAIDAAEKRIATLRENRSPDEEAAKKLGIDPYGHGTGVLGLPRIENRTRADELKDELDKLKKLREEYAALQRESSAAIAAGRGEGPDDSLRGRREARDRQRQTKEREKADRDYEKLQSAVERETGPEYQGGGDAAAAETRAEAARQAQNLRATLQLEREETYRNRDAVTALSDGWQRFGARISDTSRLLETSVVSVAGAFSDDLATSLVDVVSGSKDADDALKELFGNLAKNLATVATQYLIAYIFKTLFFGGATPAPAAGALHGGVYGGRGRGDEVFRHHEMLHGGVAGDRSVVVYGEGSRREAFVPLQDGRAIPVRIEGGAVGGAQTVMNVYAWDSRDVVEVLAQYGHVYRGAVTQGVSRYGRDRRVFASALR